MREGVAESVRRNAFRFAMTGIVGIWLSGCADATRIVIPVYHAGDKSLAKADEGERDALKSRHARRDDAEDEGKKPGRADTGKKHKLDAKKHNQDDADAEDKPEKKVAKAEKPKKGD